MVEIDIAAENLKAIQRAGWKVPPHHPDLVPAAEAGRLADYYRLLLDAPETVKQPTAYRELMKTSQQEAAMLEESLLRSATVGELDSHLAIVTNSCKDCHRTHRD